MSRWSSQGVVIAAILLLALAVRLWGIGHDLPTSYFPDEAQKVKRALSFGSGDLNPHWFHKPAFYMYLLFVEYGCYFCAGYLAGWWNSVTEFGVHFVINPGPFYLMGRLTTVTFSMLTVWGVYRIGERFFSKHVGLAAALLIALTAGHISASREVKADIPAACFGVWSIYFLLGYARDARLRQLLLSAAMAGLGAATKYYTLLMLVPLTAIVILPLPRPTHQRWTQRLGWLLLGVSVFWGSFFVGSPYNFLDATGRQWTLRPLEVLWRRGGESIGRDAEPNPHDIRDKQADIVGGLRGYAACLLSAEGMGPVIGAICLAGLVAVLASRRREGLLLGLYSLLFALISVVTFPGYAESRHQTPLYPLLAVAGGAILVAASRRWGTWVAAAAAVALIWPAYQISATAHDLSKEDTRNVACRWVEDNIRAGTKLLCEENGPPLKLSAEALQQFEANPGQENVNQAFTRHFDRYLHYQRLAAKEVVSYNVFEIRPVWWRNDLQIDDVIRLASDYDADMGNPRRPVGVKPYSDYVANGYQYAIVQRGSADGFVVKQESQQRDAYQRFYAELFAQGVVVQEFAPNGQLRGPVVRVYRLSAGDSANGKMATSPE